MKQNLKPQAQKIRTFRRLGWATILAVYFLILVGGIVRSTGSGMGCPDWPKCFGSYVPPTDVSELPENYQDIYAEQRAQKNERFAGMLQKMGFDDTAEQLLADESILEEAAFNPVKTWIEYINRLIGVVIGFLILGTFISSIKFFNSQREITVGAFSALVLVIFQAWLGSIVVSTNLLPWLVTLHMLVALLIVAVLIYVVYKAGTVKDAADGSAKIDKRSIGLLLLCIGSIVIQIVLGTQVRESIDEVARSYDYNQRGNWIDGLGLTYYIHRSYSILIVIIHIGLLYSLYKYSLNRRDILNLGKILVGTVFLAMLTGVTMAWFGMPAFAQPIHLLLATLIFGLQFLLLLKINYRVKSDVIAYSKA